MQGKTCIIAINFENKYFSIRCFYDGEKDVDETLHRRLNDEVAVLRFIAQGDIELRTGQGLLLKNIDAQLHPSPLALVTYAIEQNAQDLYLFEDGDWRKTPLYTEEIIQKAG